MIEWGQRRTCRQNWLAAYGELRIYVHVHTGSEEELQERVGSLKTKTGNTRSNCRPQNKAGRICC